MIREFEYTQKDYKQFIELFYRTEYSYSIGKVSDENILHQNLYIPNHTLYYSMVNSDNYQYLAFCNSGDVIGAVSFRLIRKTCLINEFFIMRSLQLHGYGRKFYTEFEKYLIDCDVEQIRLVAFAPGSIVFWRKMGFVFWETNLVKNLN